jgi:hypothetical protein
MGCSCCGRHATNSSQRNVQQVTYPERSAVRFRRGFNQLVYTDARRLIDAGLSCDSFSSRKPEPARRRDVRTDTRRDFE